MRYPYNVLEAAGYDISNLLDEDHESAILTAIASLTPKERDVIRQRFRDNKSRKEVAKNHKLSYERIRQIEVHSLRRLCGSLRRGLIEKGVEQYFNDIYYSLGSSSTSGSGCGSGSG